MTPPSKLKQQLQLWWPAALVVSVGAVFSGVLQSSLQARNEQLVQQRLQEQATLFSNLLELRLYAYADHLKSLRPLLEQDAQAAQALDLEMEAQYPGLGAMSVVRKLGPEEGRLRLQSPTLARSATARQLVRDFMVPPWLLNGVDAYVAQEVWPLSTQRRVLKLDAGQDAGVQLEQFLHADLPVLTATFPWPEVGESAVGMLMSVPLRAQAPEQSPGALQGALNISIRVDQLLEHVREKSRLHSLGVAIYDTTSSTQDSQPHKTLVAAHWDADKDMLAASRRLEVMGRQWTLEFAAGGKLLSEVERTYPTIMAASAMGATTLLAGLVFLLSIRGVRAEVRVRTRHHLLRQRNGRFRALFHQSAVGVAEIDPDSHCYLRVNQRFAEIVGSTEEALLGQPAAQGLDPEDRALCEQLKERLRLGLLPHYSQQIRLTRPDGQKLWCEVWVSPLTLDKGKSKVQRYIVLLTDVSERHRMQEQLQQRAADSSEMLRHMPVGFVVLGSSGQVELVNRQFERTTGWTHAQLPDADTLWHSLHLGALGRAVLLQTQGQEQPVSLGHMPTKEYVVRCKDGRDVSMEIAGCFVDGRLLLSFVDVSQRKAAEAKVRWLGYYDTLTQLPNRRLLLERLGAALERSRTGEGSRGALLLLDIDNFKTLNETVGHEHGDALLRLVAKRLSGCITGRHTLARQDGDEFAVVLEDLPSDSLEAGRHTEHVGSIILQALRTPFYLGSQDFHVTVSMGAAMFSGAQDSVKDLLKRADLALFQAKSAGRDTLQFFDPSMQRAVSARVAMEKDIRLALERHEFDLYYQPQVQQDRVIGAEALLRWKHPTKGFVSPEIFVPAAEESGLILPLGEWALYAACRQLAQWARQPALAHLTMSVNVSPRQFYQADFVDQVQHALTVTGAQASQLELELTEGMLLTDVDDTIRKMVRLKALGVIFSLDDFGTGYSSLSYLKRLPLDKLKIDQSFVREVQSSSNDAAIARSIIALGHSLGLQVIAEGVETQEQRRFLADNGCSYWQGYLFSRPVPVQEFEAWISAYHGSIGAAHAIHLG